MSTPDGDARRLAEQFPYMIFVGTEQEIHEAMTCRVIKARYWSRSDRDARNYLSWAHINPYSGGRRTGRLAWFALSSVWDATKYSTSAAIVLRTDAVLFALTSGFATFFIVVGEGDAYEVATSEEQLLAICTEDARCSPDTSLKKTRKIHFMNRPYVVYAMPPPLLATPYAVPVDETTLVASKIEIIKKSKRSFDE